MLLLPAMVLCSCNSNKQDDEVAIAVTLRGDTIQIGDKSPILSRLKTDVVKKEAYRPEFTTSGVVRAIPSGDRFSVCRAYLQIVRAVGTEGDAG